MRAGARGLLLFGLALLVQCTRHKPEVPILTWHSIAEQGGDFTVSPERFAAQLDALQAAGFHTLPLRALLDHLDRGAPLPPKPLVLTFDDGYADAATQVLPALRARGMVAAFFVSSARIGVDEAHRVRGEEQGQRVSYLIAPELRALAAAGMEVGSHARTHPRLPSLGAEEQQREIVGSRQELAAMLSQPVTLFAYPFNAVDAAVERRVAAAGYALAVAGEVHGTDQRYRLYRLGVHRQTSPAELLRALAASR